MYRLIITVAILLAICCGATNAKASQKSRGQPSCLVKHNGSDTAYSPIDNHDGTVTFMNQLWSVIKDMGDGQVMIGSVKAIGHSPFSPKDQPYYPSSSISFTNDGYSDSLIKKKVDAWYEQNIQGTAYEKFLVPVHLHNPTFLNMKKLGWQSHTNGRISTHSWRVHVIGPDAYPTTVDYLNGSKQAFLLSGSDLAEKNPHWPPDYYTGKLLLTAIHYRDRLYNNGVHSSWLRSPSEDAYAAAGLYARDSHIRDYVVWHSLAVVPALVIKLK